MANTDGHGAGLDSELSGHSDRMDVHTARLAEHDDRIAALEHSDGHGVGEHSHDDGSGGAHSHAGLNSVPERGQFRMPSKPGPRLAPGAASTFAKMTRRG
jgi:hypothetical protein